MTAAQEVEARALKFMERDPTISKETAKTDVRAAYPNLSAREREEVRSQPRTFREPPKPPVRTAAYHRIETLAKKMMETRPELDALAARERIRKIYPDLKKREMDEEMGRASDNLATRLQRHGESADEDETRAALKDSEREETSVQRDRREASTAFVAMFTPDVQRKVDSEDLDLEGAVHDVVRAVLVSAFKAKVKGGKPKTKAASSRTVSPQLFAERVVKRMRSGPVGHHLLESIADTMKSLAS